MNQYHWTYWDQKGRQHVIGIMHGATSGHLMIHLNSRILVIDFQVFGAKKYSFLINEEICEINVELSSSGFQYHLGLNAEQVAQFRKEQKQKDRKAFFQHIQMLAVACAVIFVFSMAVFLLIG